MVVADAALAHVFDQLAGPITTQGYKYSEKSQTQKVPQNSILSTMIIPSSCGANTLQSSSNSENFLRSEIPIEAKLPP